MKTFGLFIIQLLVSILFTFSIWKNAEPNELLKMLLATQMAYIIYRLIKEEEKK